MSHIYVDADACPVVKQIENVAKTNWLTPRMSTTFFAGAYVAPLGRIWKIRSIFTHIASRINPPMRSMFLVT